MANKSHIRTYRTEIGAKRRLHALATQWPEKAFLIATEPFGFRYVVATRNPATGRLAYRL